MSEGGSRFRFPAHLTARELADGVDAGALIEGTVRVDPRDPSRATLDVTSVGGDAADVDGRRRRVRPERTRHRDSHWLRA